MSVATATLPIASDLLSVLRDAKRILKHHQMMVPASLFESFEAKALQAKGFCSALGRTLSPSNLPSDVSPQDINDFRWAMREAWATRKI